MKFKVILFTIILVVLVVVGASNSGIMREFRMSESEPKIVGVDSVSVDSVISLGATYLGKPYRYKGDAPWSLDCSGFISYIYSEFVVKSIDFDVKN